MKHTCKQEKVLDLILKKLDNVEVKVDNLLRFKWQILGFISGVTIIATLISNIIL